MFRLPRLLCEVPWPRYERRPGRLGALRRRVCARVRVVQSLYQAGPGPHQAPGAANRTVALLASSFLNFLALRYLQLDQALAITFSTPFLVALLAGPVLNEWVGARRWAAIGAGFLGVLVVTRPGFGSIHPAALLSLTAAFTLAFYNVTTRLLARWDSSETTLFYSNLVGVLATTPMLPFVWSQPSFLDVILMVVVGAFGTIGHYLLIVAHRFTPASVLSPFMYTQLVWATTLGFVVFHDVPNKWTLAGAGIVVGSGLYLLHRERIKSGR
jgi:drug/metabolite transporter (DMT)-like permease